MRMLLKASLIVSTTFVIMIVVLLSRPLSSQTPAVYKAPRTSDGKPNLSGIWQAINTANWDLQDHAARQGPLTALGASFSVPGGLGVVEGNEIPVQARGAGQEERERSRTGSSSTPRSSATCPGVPRATYMPYPFQIVQTPEDDP